MNDLPGLFLTNSQTGEKEEFRPADPGRVKIYSCGPTVYNFNHIGNLRSYLFVDILRRSLKLLGFVPDQTMNITDIDDKIINQSIEKKISIEEFTRPWIDAFFEDIKTLRVEELEHYPRATESIEEMMKIIDRLKENGLVYERDGNVYYSISHFQNYGKLSKIDLSGMISGARYDADEYRKEDLRDFVLWKAPKLEGEKSWQTRHGLGRPGWHLECSAMIRQVYQSGIDIHTGGIDLLFPHHENEIAQSEGAFPEEKFVKYWVHCEHLLVEGQKMSKSLGNFYTLRDLIAMNYSPLAIRYLFLSYHYATKLNFSLSRLEEAEKAISRIQNTLDRLLPDEPGALPSSPPSGFALPAFKEFLASLADDLNTPRALGKVFEFLKEINTKLDSDGLKEDEKLDCLSYFYEINRLLDILHFEKDSLNDSDVERLILERTEAKKSKNFARADAIRDELLEKGILLEDTKNGVKWKRK
ncbi:MAG: cysteine--tRNA ligase [Leptospiraceae bacterium]|nr:cysteine--tRNA ligase [Leptospiraceae bacterium]MCP5511831.1 cysteine--tRNA ligase [Leptospiraceae bacterium]